MRRLFTAFATIALLVAAAPPASAQGSYVSTESLGYGCTVTKYATLLDAQTSSGALRTGTCPADRDLSVYFINNNAAFAGLGYPASAAYFLSYWYAGSVLSDYSDANSPSNNNYGFVQLADADGATFGSFTGTWLNAGMTTYGLSVTGGPSIPGCVTAVEDCGRLWNGNSSGALAGGGSFLNYSVNLTFGGLNPAVFNAATGVFESISQPASVSGSISGYFQNTTDDPGFYSFVLNPNLNSWAFANGIITPSYFGSADVSTDVVPEPASMMLLATGLAGMAAARRKRRQA